MKEKQHEQQVGNISSYFRQTMRFMRLSLFFMVVSTTMAFSAATYSQNTKLSVNLRDATVREVIKAIEEQSEFLFLYQEGQVDLNRRVSIRAEGKQLQEILDEVFKGTDNIYIVSDRQVVIGKAPRKNLEAQLAALQKDMKVNLFQQQQKVKIIGKVTDENGDPLPGVTITVLGTTRGVITDKDGTYSIEVQPSDKLTFSFVGMESQIISIGKQKVIDVKMKEKSEELEEITVIGYGTQKKESVVSSISSITSKQLITPSRNLTNNLAGKVPGLIAIQRSGEPGYDNAEFWIRGISSFKGGTNPLVLVDGVPRRMEDIEPDEIESFTLLKDAAATAVYGAEGANGVILITSKRGKAQKTKITFRAEANNMTPTRLPKFLNAEQTLRLINEAENNVGNPDKFPEEYIANFATGTDRDLYPDVNWLDLLKDRTSSQRYTLNVRGGSDKAKYFVSGAYFHESGIFKSNPLERYDTNIGLQRYNLRSNIDFDPTTSTTVKVDMSGQYLVTNYPGVGTPDIFRSITRAPVFLFPMIYSDGTIAGHPRPSANRVNPYNQLMNSGYSKEWRTYIQSKVEVDQKLDFITNGLSAKAAISYDADMSFTTKRTKNPSQYIATSRDENGKLLFSQVVQGSNDLSAFNNSNSGRKNIYFETSVNYKRIFEERHNIGGMLLYMQKESQYHNEPLAYKKQGFVGRLTYGFEDRYFLEGNFGYTGSEAFAKGHRFGFFPAIGIGWYLSNEPYYPQNLQNIIPKFKLRVSIGRTGNDNTGGDRFLYRGTMNTSASGYNVGYHDNGTLGGIGNGIVEGRFEAPYLSWEIEDKKNYGIDLGLLGNKIDIMIDRFNNRRHGILLQRNTVSNVTGFQQMPWQNYGIVNNKGIDGSINLNHHIGDWNFQVMGNITFARNEIKEYDQIPQKYPWMEKIGTRINGWDLYIAEGLYKENDFIISGEGLNKTYTLKPEFPVPAIGGDIKPGDIKYKDLNGDGKIDNFDIIVDAVQPSVPELVYGFGLNVSYKSLYAGIFFQGAGNTSTVLGANYPESFFPFAWGFEESSLRAVVLDRWTEESQREDVMFPRLRTYSHPHNNARSTWWARDASFLRLKNIEMGYNLPNNLLEKYQINALRIYFMANNVAVWDKIKMWDPEQGNANGGFSYPLPRTLSLGIEFTF